MGLLSNLFGSSSDNRGHPPKPDDTGPRSEEIVVDVYETAFHYKNGDTETAKTYGQHRNRAQKVVYNDEFTASQNWTGKGISSGFEPRVVSYKVLTRDPIDEYVGTETWRVTWEQDYEKKMWNHGGFKCWEPVAKNVEYELVEGVDDGQSERDD